MPRRKVSRSRSVIARFAGTVSSSGLSMRLRTLRFASSGNSGSTGSSRRSFASSTRIMAAAAVIGFVIEAMRKIVSRRIGSLPPKAFTPIASTCVSPRRLTSVTSPGIRPLWTWRAMASRMRARRALDNPPLPEGGLPAACGDCAAASAALALPAVAVAQSPQAAARPPSGKGGLSRARLARMREAMARHVQSGRMPGLVTLVSRRGETHVDAIGVKAFGGREPMRRDTIFRIASITKPITAAAAMILVEEAKLRLDDPVDPLLPELANRKVLKRIDSPLEDTVPAKRAITLRDLLTFRLGIGAVMVYPEKHPIQKAMSEAGVSPSANLPAQAADELMKRWGSLPLAHQPGEKWMYNSGSDILGILISRATGKPLGAFLRERIFAPLGMKDTAFSVPEAELDRLATAYQTDFATGKTVLFDEARGGRFARPPVFESGAGGLVSTVDDFLAFGRMMLAKGLHGRERILSRPSVELMTADHITAEQKAASDFFPGFWDDRGWGFGMAIVTRRADLARSLGTFGWDGGYGTSWYAEPREDMTGILMTQRVWESPVAPAVNRDFWTSAYQAIDD